MICCLKGSLKMEATGSSETLLPGWETKWYYSRRLKVWCDSGCFSLLEWIFFSEFKKRKRKRSYNGAIFVCVFAY